MLIYINFFHLNIITIIDLFIIIQGSIFGFLILKGDKKKTHLLYLGLMLIVFSLEEVPDLIESIVLIKNYPFLTLFPFDFTWISSALLYIYVQRIPEINNNNISYRHLYVGIFCSLIIFTFFFLPIQIKTTINSSLLFSFYEFLVEIYSFVLIFLSFSFLHKKKKEIKKNFYEFEFSEFRWAYYFSIILMISLVILILILILIIIFNTLDNFKIELGTLIAGIADLVFQYVIIIYALKHKYLQKKIYQYIIVNKKRSKSNENILDTEKKELNNIILLLDKYLIETHAFTKSNFSITDASVALNIHPKKVSTALNLIKFQNFNTYVNEYRVEAAKKILEKNESSNYTIEGIGNMVGFNSKSVFYKEFKNNTGNTPSQYLKKFI